MHRRFKREAGAGRGLEEAARQDQSFAKILGGRALHLLRSGHDRLDFFFAQVGDRDEIPFPDGFYWVVQYHKDIFSTFRAVLTTSY